MGVMIFWCKQCDLQEKLPGRFVSASFSTQVPWMKENCRIVLASSSPRRQEILSLLGEPPKKNEDKTTNVCKRISVSGIPFEVVTPKFAEVSIWEWKSLWEFMIRRWRLLEIFFLGLHCKELCKARTWTNLSTLRPGKLGLQGENAVGFPWYPHEVDQVRQ